MSLTKIYKWIWVALAVLSLVMTGFQYGVTKKVWDYKICFLLLTSILCLMVFKMMQKTK